MAEIQKGKISSISGGKAKVIPSTTSTLTPDLMIPPDLQKNITVNTEVVFAVFEDRTGIILARTDGQWSQMQCRNYEK